MNSQLISVYADDFFLHCQNFEECLETFETLLKNLRKMNLRLSQKKTLLFYNKVVAIGHLISPQGVQINPKIVREVENFAAPTNVKQVRQYLGLCSYSRIHIPRFAQIADPLYQMIGKRKKFIWTDKEQRSFEELKRALIRNIKLAHFNPEAEIALYTDSSKQNLGGTLLQRDKDTNQWSILGFCSRRLAKSEKNYDMMTLELTAFVYALKYFRYILLGAKFTAYLDNKAIVTLKSAPDKHGKLSRMSHFIGQYDFTVKHVPSELNLADILTRNINNPEYSEEELQL